MIDKIMAENGNDIEKHKNAFKTAKTEILAYRKAATPFSYHDRNSLNVIIYRKPPILRMGTSMKC